MDSLTEEKRKEMLAEMNRFEQEILVPDTDGSKITINDSDDEDESDDEDNEDEVAVPRVIIGSNTYHQVQARLDSHDSNAPSRFPLSMFQNPLPPPPPPPPPLLEPPTESSNRQYFSPLPPPPPPPGIIPRHMPAFTPPQLRPHAPPPPPPPLPDSQASRPQIGMPSFPAQRATFPQPYGPPRPPIGPNMGLRPNPFPHIGPLMRPSIGPISGIHPHQHGGPAPQTNPGIGMPAGNLPPPPGYSNNIGAPALNGGFIQGPEQPQQQPQRLPAPSIIAKTKVVYAAAPVRNIVKRKKVSETAAAKHSDDTDTNKDTSISMDTLQFVPQSTKSKRLKRKKGRPEEMTTAAAKTETTATTTTTTTTTTTAAAGVTTTSAIEISLPIPAGPECAAESAVIAEGSMITQVQDAANLSYYYGPTAPLQAGIVPGMDQYLTQQQAEIMYSIEGIPMATMAGIGKKQKREKKNNKFVRTAAGQIWEDQTLMEWGTDDFRIFAGDLGNEVTDEMLIKMFQKYPSFLRAKVVRDKRSNKTKGYGFISFKDPNDFAQAMRECNGRYVGNRPIKLRKSNWKDRSIDVVRKKDKEKKMLGFR